MKYKVYIVLLLLVTLFAGCGGSTAVIKPATTPGQTETVTAAADQTASQTASSAETAVAESSAAATDVTQTAAPQATTPNETVPGATNPISALIEEVIPDNPVYHTTERITISAIGDILTHANILECVRNGDKYDFDPPFSEVMPILEAADLTIGNLETTMAGPSAVYEVIPGYNGYPKFNTPDSLLDTLKKAGLDVLINANNHCLDRGSEGLVRTIDQMEARGFLHTGAYKTKEDSQKILVTDVKGIKIAILAYTYSTNGQPIKAPCAVNLLKLDKMVSDVKMAKELKPDIIITYLHFGDEYERQPNSLQKRIADSLLKAGADIVLGNHPHVLQPMERKTITDDNGQQREGLIIYSLGNFTTGFTIPYSNTTGIFNIDIEKDILTGKVSIKETRLIPTWVQLYKRDGRSSYRVMPISSAIEKYESKTDQYITEKDYEFLKGRQQELFGHVYGPVK